MVLVFAATPAGAGPRRGPGYRQAAPIPVPATATTRADDVRGNQGPPVGSPSDESGLRDELALGDEAYARFDNEAALDHYRKAVEAAPGDAEALWRLALAHADVGKALEETDRDAAEEHYRQGEEAAHRAIAANPDLANAHFVLAVCLGRLALLEGGKTRIRLSKEVKAEAERTIELDPTHDGAYSVLGRWNYAIATLGWLTRAFARVVYGGIPAGATMEKAAEMFRKAVELDPGRPAHHLEYARALVHLGRYSEATRQLRMCLELPRVQWDDPASRAEAARLLREIDGKKDDG